MKSDTLFKRYEIICKETKSASDCEEVLYYLYEEKAKEYIENYFDVRGKCKAFKFDYLNGGSKILNKAIHTFSTFLLGFSLKVIVQDILNKYIGEKNPTWKNWDFEYTWFLTSLYHDCFSAYEKRSAANSEKYSLKQFLEKEESGFEYSIYDKHLNGKILKGSNVPEIEPFYQEDIINKYFEYRMKEMNSIDHGIVGGYVQFDRLVKNFKEQYESAFNSNKFIDGVFYTDYNERTLVWREQHLWHFAFVADAILSHNIWYVDSSDDELARKYRKYGLDSLIVCKDEGSIENRVTLEKSPLLFFLAIIDTIEPTKYFNTINPKFVLENISIFYDQQEKLIEIIADKKIFNIELWYKKIEDLKTWINIKDTVLDDNKIIIILK